MRTTICTSLVLTVCLGLAFNHASAFQIHQGRITTEELGIEVKGPSREVAYTNKEGGVLSTETNTEHRSGWQGWRIASHEVLEDYSVSLDGIPLRKSTALRVVVYPHQLKRYYPNGVVETVTMLDSVHAFTVELENVHARELIVYPLLSGWHAEDEFVTIFERNVLLFAKRDNQGRTVQNNYPAAVAVSWMGENLWTATFYDSTVIGENYSPAHTKTVQNVSYHALVFAAGDSLSGAYDLAKMVAREYRGMIAARKNRMEQLLNRSAVRTDNPEFDKALNWAKISLDALMTNHPAIGIYAGLPWFDNYWGRDTYISLAGAALVTGNFAHAQQILRSFARWQEKDSASTNYGRIPNQVSTGSTSYNTADGTPRFTIALTEYLRYSGDTSFAAEMYQVLQRAVEGTLKYHVDDNGFLKHGDAESWMDAVGPDGPWSPRGDRANDIQALWYHQLLATAAIGEALHLQAADSRFLQRVRSTANTLRTNFQKYFVDEQHRQIYDHLTPNGAYDSRLRPNQLFDVDPRLFRPSYGLDPNGLDTIPSLVDEQTKREVFKSVTANLVYPHGVASLWQGDENFHPYHHLPTAYVPDAAYHNGIVWTWLAGPWVDLAVQYGRQDLAFEVTQSMTHQLLTEGAVGALSELMDAAPREGEQHPRLSGAFSQAWSLAEFIRTFYQSYLGVDVNVLQHTLTLNPRLPRPFSKAQFVVAMDTSHVAVAYDVLDSSETIVLSSIGGSENLRLNLSCLLRNGHGIRASATLKPGQNVKYVAGSSRIVQETNGTSSAVTGPTMFDAPPGLADLALATPDIRPDVKSLRKPSHRLLTNSEIKQSNISANLFYDVDDPEGDDIGTGNYTYPLTSSLNPGSLDITRFTVSMDEKNLYFKLQFRNLSDPGWHPEYGFQLTYVAIAVNKNEKSTKHQRNVGMNAQYVLNPLDAYDRIIYVGGGVQLADAQNNIMAEYIPLEGDEKNPLGSARMKAIEFSLPLQLLGKPTKSWRFTVLVGAQDDHGGAGIGNFRAVDSKAKEWVGGGKKKSTDPNIYDVVLPKR